jgi:hypothetical protein
MTLSKAEKHRGRRVNSTSITRLHHHRPHHLHREHQQKERKRTETKTSVAIVFVVPGRSDNRLCIEASAPLSSSISVTREGEEENTKNETKKRRTRGTKIQKKNLRTKAAEGKKTRSLVDQVSCLLFPAFVCILSCICYCSSEI